MLMAESDFVVDMADHIAHREFTGVHSHLCLENDMEQYISEFFKDHIVVGTVQPIEQFIGFLQEIPADQTS